jgi:hypothetical protein
LSTSIEVAYRDGLQHVRGQFEHRVVLYSAGAEPDLKSACLLWDPVAAPEPPAETMLLEVYQMLDAGETVLLSCADQRRRDYVMMVTRARGWRAHVSRSFADAAWMAGSIASRL